MNEEDFKPFVKTFLSELGFRVNYIPRQNSRTPDFDVEGNNSRYTVELKIKSDDPDEIERDNEVLSRGEILSKTTPIGPRNRLYAIIKDGVDQIKEHDPENKTFHVLWIHSEGRDPELLKMRFHATLFGTQSLISTERDSVLECYFFKESAFYTLKGFLDGVILTYNDQLQLCVNTLSSRKKYFQQSELYKSLSCGLCDPDILQNEEGIMIADCKISRKEKNKIIQFLKNKYNLDHLQTIDMKQYSGRIAIPKKD